MMETNEIKAAMTRAEWIAALAFGMNVLTLAFVAGVLWKTVEDNTRRIQTQETKMDAVTPKLERIDANVVFLTERAREDRERHGR